MKKQEYKIRFIRHMQILSIAPEVTEAEFFGIEPDQPWLDAEPTPERDADECISYWTD